LTAEKIADKNDLERIVAEVSDYLESELAIAEEAGFPRTRFGGLRRFRQLDCRARIKKKVLEK
jgi:hypothetical protein